MEKFPKMSEMIRHIRIPLDIQIHPYMRDHQFAGKAVLPAVESCSILASNVEKHIPGVNANDIYDASFDKFIEIKPEQDAIQAFNDIEIYEDGTVVSKLSTRIKSVKSGITRTNEHVVLRFKKHEEPLRELTYDKASVPDGISFQITAQDIYKDLVMFGPAYHNITDILYVCRSGAAAEVSAPAMSSPGPLGSPFPFDAAMHAASVWGQRYFNIAAFPVAFDRRVIPKPTVPGEKYFARVIPVQAGPDMLIFDIWIYDYQGMLCEAGLGIKIRDVNAGKIKPAEWIVDKDNMSLKNISPKCEGVSVVEINAIPEFASKALSDDELRRLAPMAPKRRKSYLGARLACKFLSRKLSKDESGIPAHEITTISDNIYPACPLTDGSEPFRCSVSHDSRFAVAAASAKRIGIDVEEISGRVLKSGRLYMSAEEKVLVDSSELDEKEACLRIWSIKEAVAKALDAGLTRSWEIARVNKIGRDISTLLIDGAEINAYHDTIDGHLFTLVELE